MIKPVILAGGSGTRLWPLSRSSYPKQFLNIHGKLTMFQQTVTRLSGVEHEACIFICNEEHRFLAAEQLRQLGILHDGIILEPQGRNTAPAIALSAFHALKNDTDAILLILPADHVIGDEDAFCQAIKIAERHARDDKLVTFGVVPRRVETGFGYVKKGRALPDAYIGAGFVEKPNLAAATEYVESEEYYWNGGIFMFKASRYLEMLHRHRPVIYDICKNALAAESRDLDFIRMDEKEFLSCPSESVDFAIMEAACQSGGDDVIIVPLDADWSDVGSFAALREVSEINEAGNIFLGDVHAVNSKNTMVRATDRLVATVGVEDLIIIDTKDSLLVAHKDSAQDVKLIVEKLANLGRGELKLNREVFRPWGKYDLIDTGKGFQAKRITVNPGGKLSVQTHTQRAEHWVVVSGTAQVMIDGKFIILKENQSTYIPIGVQHSLENAETTPLEIIEVQTGSYFGEDDILRFEDKYGRV